MSGRARNIMRLVVISGVVLAGILGGRSVLWSGTMKPVQGGMMSSVQAAPATTASGEAESLQNAFIRVGEQAGPAVVSISTEQIERERVRQYFRAIPRSPSSAEAARTRLKSSSASSTAARRPSSRSAALAWGPASSSTRRATF